MTTPPERRGIIETKRILSMKMRRA